jgi:hypothetical protein
MYNIFSILIRKREGHNFGDRNVDGSVILRRILRKCGVRIMAEFKLLRKLT